MSYNVDVATFTDLLGPFYEFVAEEDDNDNNNGKVGDDGDEEDFSDSGIELRSGKMAQLLGKYDRDSGKT